MPTKTSVFQWRYCTEMQPDNREALEKLLNTFGEQGWEWCGYGLGLLVFKQWVSVGATPSGGCPCVNEEEHEDPTCDVYADMTDEQVQAEIERLRQKLLARAVARQRASVASTSSDSSKLPPSFTPGPVATSVPSVSPTVSPRESKEPVSLEEEPATVEQKIAVYEKREGEQYFRCTTCDMLQPPVGVLHMTECPWHDAKTCAMCKEQARA